MLHLTSELLIGLSVSLFAAEPHPKQIEPSIRVECHGQLRHGMVAIGGETTGTTLACDCIKCELKFSDEASRKFASEHHKKPITAIGKLRRVVGTEVPVRWIVDVEHVTERDAKTQKSGASLTVVGTLRIAEAAAGMPPETVIDSAGVVWPLDLSADPRMKTKAESLTTKSVVLVGQLEHDSKSGGPHRTVIRVEKLDSASSSHPRK